MKSTKWVKLKLSEWKRLVKALKECLAANKALNDQNDKYNSL